MKLSKKIIDIEPSSTVILGQKARELISSGKDVIQLGEKVNLILILLIILLKLLIKL